MSYKHIIFDLDGTLINPEKGIINSFNYVFDKMKIELDNSFNYKKLIGPPIHDGFIKAFKLSEEEADQGVAFFREYYGRQGLYESFLYEGIADLIEALSLKGKKIYLATSKFEKYAVEILKDKKIHPFFSYVAGAAYKGNGAGKELLIGRVLKHIPENERNEVVMIGDTRYDIEGAQQAGISSIGVLYGYGSREVLEREGAGNIVDGVSDLGRVLLAD